MPSPWLQRELYGCWAADYTRNDTDPTWWHDGDTRKCSGCGKVREHTIARISKPGRPILCNRCNEENHEPQD